MAGRIWAIMSVRQYRGDATSPFVWERIHLWDEAGQYLFVEEHQHENRTLRCCTLYRKGA